MQLRKHDFISMFLFAGNAAIHQAAEPVGDLRTLLENCGGVSPAASVPESDNLFDDEFLDATENMPAPSQQSSVGPLHVSMDLESQTGTDEQSQQKTQEQNSQEVEGETVNEETRLQRFRLKSVCKFSNFHGK